MEFRLYGYMSLNATVQYMPVTITNPALADDILILLLSNETNSYSASQLASQLNSNPAEIETQIQAINTLKARWVYEIRYIGDPDNYYIIGNCKPQIREYLKRGGFTKTNKTFAALSFLSERGFKSRSFASHLPYLFYLATAIIILFFIYIFIRSL